MNAHRLSPRLDRLEDRIVPTGVMDPAFGNDGFVYYHIGYIDYASDVVQQPDKKYLLAGGHWGVGSANGFVVRLNLDGSFDPTFGNNGVASVEMGGEESGAGVLLQPSGKVIWVGSSYHYGTTSYDAALVRYNSDGSLDKSFGFDGWVTQDFGGTSDFVYDAMFQDDKILVLSHFIVGGVMDYAVRRYSANGVFDTSFGVNGSAVVDVGGGGSTPRSMALQADGKIVIAGYSTLGDSRIARLNANGSIDTAFGGGDGIVIASVPTLKTTNATSVIIQADGEILVGGYGGELVANRNDFALMRFDQNGNPDPSLNGTGKMSLELGDDEVLYALGQQDDGKIVASGESGIRYAIARMNLDGSLDPTFDDNGIFYTTTPLGIGSNYTSMLVQRDGKLAIAGQIGATNSGAFSMLRLLTGTGMDPPQANAGGPYNVFEGSSISLNGGNSFDAQDPQSNLTFEWDLDGDAVFGETGAAAAYGDEVGITPEFNAVSFDGPAGPLTIQLRVTDTTDLTDTVSTTITIDNAKPVADVDGPASALHGLATVFALSATDAGSADQATGFAYHVNWGDGNSQDVPRAAGNGAGVALDHVFISVGTYTVAVTATDDDGGVSNAGSASITITSAAPTASITGPSSGLRGETLSFNLSATDSDAGDEAAGFLYHLVWGDGTTQDIARTAGNGSGVSVDHAYAAAGHPTLTATDISGAVSNAAGTSVTTSITRFAGGVLEVSGTPGPDTISLTRPAIGVLSLRLNGVFLGTYTGVNRFVAYGWAGSDLIQVATGITIATELYGGTGNDVLRGGSGPNILDGGDGFDQLFGGMARDLLVGGQDADGLNGGGNDDILIGDLFMPGQSPTARRAALSQALVDWNAATSYAARTAAMVTDLAGKVSADTSRDVLLGGLGRDWFFGKFTGPLRDVLVDRVFNELVTGIS